MTTKSKGNLHHNHISSFIEYFKTLMAQISLVHFKLKNAFDIKKIKITLHKRVCKKLTCLILRSMIWSKDDLQYRVCNSSLIFFMPCIMFCIDLALCLHLYASLCVDLDLLWWFNPNLDISLLLHILWSFWTHDVLVLFWRSRLCYYIGMVIYFLVSGCENHCVVAYFIPNLVL